MGNSTTINLSIPKELLLRLDEYANEEYASRSEVIRNAILKLLRDDESGWHSGVSFRAEGGLSAKELLQKMEKFKNER